MENFFIISVLSAFLSKNFLHLRTPLLQILLNFAKIFLILSLSAFLPYNFSFCGPLSPFAADPHHLPTYVLISAYQNRNIEFVTAAQVLNTTLNLFLL